MTKDLKYDSQGHREFEDDDYSPYCKKCGSCGEKGCCPNPCEECSLTTDWREYSDSGTIKTAKESAFHNICQDLIFANTAQEIKEARDNAFKFIQQELEAVRKEAEANTWNEDEVTLQENLAYDKGLAEGYEKGFNAATKHILTSNQTIINARTEERERIRKIVEGKKIPMFYGHGCKCGREWWFREQHNKALSNIISKLDTK